MHVSIDTFSSVVIATAPTGEAARDVIRHWQRAFSVAGVPQQIKTDNGPAYLSTKVTTFLQLWEITHVTGIPHSPTGQGIVERAHGTLKHTLQKQKGGIMGEGPEARLNKATYVLNFLQVTDDVQQPPMLRHFGSLTSVGFGVRKISRCHGKLEG